MTFSESEEFETDIDPGFEGDAEYPTAFGITFTPTVGGIICGLLGVAGAIYILMTMVLPARETYQQLQSDQQTKQAQLDQLQSGETDRLILNLETQLGQARTIEPQVLSLFSSEETLDTLLLDISKFANFSNVELLSYNPQGEATLVEDSSLGELVNGKLKRKSFSLVVQGDFAEIQSFLRDLEQLQPLLVVKEFRSEVSEEATYGINQDQLVVQNQPLLRASFTLDALLPASPEEIAVSQPPEGEQPAEGN